MNRALKAQRTGKKATASQKPAVTLAYRQGKQLELETRLRIQEANAHWQRRKDMILVGTLAYVVLGSFTVWSVVLLSRSYSSAEKQLITGFIVQLLVNQFLIVAGKKIKWKG
jgi:hypothetical protein